MAFRSNFSFAGNENDLKLLTENGVEVNAVNIDGLTALRVALTLGNLQLTAPNVSIAFKCYSFQIRS